MAKIPAQLSKGLTEQEQERLAAELKSSLLAKKLRASLQERLEESYRTEEQEVELSAVFKAIGERRGYRSVLKLLPED